MFERLIERAKRTPYSHLPGYMNRWWLVPIANRDYGYGCGPVSWRRPIAKILQHFGVAIRVHEILRSDLGRDPHNHPWPFVSIILKGMYIEERYDLKGVLTQRNVYGPGDILVRPANTWHRLDLVGGSVTTLFITGRKCQDWGFNVDGKFVPHREYDLDRRTHERTI